MIREHQVSPVGDEDPPRGGDAPLGELVQLAEEGLRLEHHTVADDADDTGVQNAGGDLSQHELGVADDDRMPGVGPALIAHDQVGPLGEHVHQLALAFVAPLGPDDYQTGRPAVEHVTPVSHNEKSPSRGS